MTHDERDFFDASKRLRQSVIALRLARTIGKIMMIRINTVTIMKLKLIGRVTNTEASPREMSIALRRFSSISGPRTNPSSRGAGWHSSTTQRNPITPKIEAR